jgi:hypothetical protein
MASVKREYRFVEETPEGMVLEFTEEAAARRRIPETRTKEPFALVFLLGWGDLAEMNMTGSEWRVLAYMISTMPIEAAGVWRTTDIATGTGMSQPAVSRVKKKLVARGVVLERDRGRLMLSPEYVWRGSAKDRLLALQEIGLAPVGLAP